MSNTNSEQIQPTNTDETNALARAAAPDLLEACQQALPVLVGYAWTDADLAAVEALRDAIQKAKGFEQ